MELGNNGEEIIERDEDIDATDLSNCCGDLILGEDICRDCKEHCISIGRAIELDDEKKKAKVFEEVMLGVEHESIGK